MQILNKQIQFDFTSSIQIAGIKTVVKFSVIVMRLMVFKNILNCTRLPPCSGVPVSCVKYKDE